MIIGAHAHLLRLMGPIIGVGLGVGIHDFSLIKQSVRNLAMGRNIQRNSLHRLLPHIAGR